MKRMNSRTWVIVASVVVGLLIIGFAAAAYAPGADERDTGSRDENSASNDPAQTEDTYRGELVCLPHKGNPEVTTMECAGGLKSDDGQYYALKDVSGSTDIPEYMTMPTGSKVIVTGTFEEGEHSVYDTIGTISVTAVERE